MRGFLGILGTATLIVLVIYVSTGGDRADYREGSVLCLAGQIRTADGSAAIDPGRYVVVAHDLDAKQYSIKRTDLPQPPAAVWANVADVDAHSYSAGCRK